MVRTDGRLADLLPDGRPPSLYAQGVEPPTFAPLGESVRTDVAVIGGGLAGLSTALHLARAGRRVAVLEGARVGSGASGRNGGQVHTGQRPEMPWIEQRLGADDARRLFAFGEEAKRLVREFARADTKGCHLREGIIAAALVPAHLDAYRRHAEGAAERYGYHATRTLDRDALAAALGTTRYAGGVRDGGAFHLDPYRLVVAIARLAHDAGAAIYEGTSVTRVTSADGRTDLTTAGGARVSAGTVVVAANGYLGDLVPIVARHVLPLNNYIAATEPLGEERLRALIPGGEGAFDSRNVVRYWRPTADGRIAFGGGETTGARLPRDIAALVRPYLAEVYPQLAHVAIACAWGGTLAITPTRAPYLRRLAPGLYTACGWSGQGIGTATFAGRVIADAIVGDTGAFDVFARLPVPEFPGGTRLRGPILSLALTWFALRDRLGL